MATTSGEGMETTSSEMPLLASEPAVVAIPKMNISRIKNKMRRSQIYRQQKREIKQAKQKEKKRKAKERKSLGDEAPPKQVPKTIESMRVADETMVTAQDEEVIAEEAVDEMSSYFNRERLPKVIITTNDRPHIRTLRLCRDLERLIPRSRYYYRKGLELKNIITQAIARDYTDILVVNEDRKTPNGLIVSHLPEGPTAHFKMSSVHLSTEMKNRDRDVRHRPEVILNNFNTRLGHSVGRLLASIFHYDPQFVGRRAVTFHNQRDFIFFRQHRYVFRNAEKVGLRELGPRFTLKLRSLQKGTFDTKFGEYEWFHRRHDMEANRRKFSL